MAIRLLEVRTGRIRTYPRPGGGCWTSAILKEPVHGPVALTRLGLQGDQVADSKAHGGLDQAVLAYASEHYPVWRSEGIQAWPGDFGENMLLSGLTDEDACIGDVYALDEVLLQVSQPRQPCTTLALRFQRKDIVPRVWAGARGGWYLRVLREGPVTSGMEWTLVCRPNPGATVARVLAGFAHAAQAPAEALLLADLEGLAGTWRTKLKTKALNE